MQQSFVYGTSDRRIAIFTDSAPFFIGYDGNNAWAEYDGAGLIVGRRLFTDETDFELAAWHPGSGTEWEYTDGIGSLRFTTAGDGTMRDTFAYDSFGNGRIWVCTLLK